MHPKSHIHKYLRQRKEKSTKSKPFLNSLLDPLVLYRPSLSTAIAIKPSAGPPVMIIQMNRLQRPYGCILCYRKDAYFGLLKIQFLLKLYTLIFMLTPQSSHLSFMLVPERCHFLNKVQLIRNIETFKSCECEI